MPKAFIHNMATPTNAATIGAPPLNVIDGVGDTKNQDGS